MTALARSCSNAVENGGFLGFELGADGSGGTQLYQPGGGSRLPASAETVAEGSTSCR